MHELDRRTLLKAGAITAGGLALPLAAPSAAEAAPRVSRVLASGLKVPWGMAFLPNGDALVGERDTGNVYRVSRNGGATPAGPVAGVIQTDGERGLDGLALSPTFMRDRLVYAYIGTEQDTRVVAMTFTNNRLGTPRVIFSGIPTAKNHVGGRLVFGPDGMLYVSTADLEQPELAQDLSSLNGKILRITPNGGIPADNPFGTAVWSYGHRNVEGLCFDSSGRLWATELGELTYDELNIIVKGGNYGWPTVEGGDGSGPIRDPFVTWSPTSTCSPSGVAIAGGYAYVGALAGQCIWSVKLGAPNAGRKQRLFYQQFLRLRTVQLAPDGSLWMTTSNNDGNHPKGANDDRVIRVLLN